MLFRWSKTEVERSSVLQKSQRNSPRFAGSTRLRTVSLHVPLFYDPMYTLSIFYHLSILQSISQSFHNLLLFTISLNHLLHLQNCFYLSTLFGSTHPLRVSEISSELILYITSPLYLFSLRLIQLNVCHIPTCFTRFSWTDFLSQFHFRKLNPPFAILSLAFSNRVKAFPTVRSPVTILTA